MKLLNDDEFNNVYRPGVVQSCFQGKRYLYQNGHRLLKVEKNVSSETGYRIAAYHVARSGCQPILSKADPTQLEIEGGHRLMDTNLTPEQEKEITTQIEATVPARVSTLDNILPVTDLIGTPSNNGLFKYMQAPRIFKIESIAIDTVRPYHGDSLSYCGKNNDFYNVHVSLDTIKSLMSGFENNWYFPFKTHKGCFIAVKLNDEVKFYALMEKIMKYGAAKTIFHSLILCDEHGDSLEEGRPTSHDIKQFYPYMGLSGNSRQIDNTNMLCLLNHKDNLQLKTVKSLLSDPQKTPPIDKIPDNLQLPTLLFFLSDFIDTSFMSYFKDSNNYDEFLEACHNQLKSFLDSGLCGSQTKDITFYAYYQLDTLKQKLKVLHQWFQQGLAEAGQVLAVIYQHGLQKRKRRSFLDNMVLDDIDYGNSSRPQQKIEKHFINVVSALDLLNDNKIGLKNHIHHLALYQAYIRAMNLTNSNVLAYHHLSQINVCDIFACSYDELDDGIIMNLIKARPNFLDEIDGKGRSILHLAIITGRDWVAGRLIETYLSGEQLNLCDNQGRNALHYSVLSNNVPMPENLIKTLLKNAPKLANQQDSLEKCPIDYLSSDDSQPSLNRVKALLEVYRAPMAEIEAERRTSLTP